MPNTVIFSCTHAPYQHKDAWDFLKDVKAIYNIKQAVHLGDEGDYHASSFHISDPKLPSAGDELHKTINALKGLAKVFPKLNIMESNHGSMFFRRAMQAGIPADAIKSYKEVLKAPKNWVWHKELIINLTDDITCLCVHQLGANAYNSASEVGISVAQGHYHSKQEIISRSRRDGSVLFGATVGCLLDNDSLAFAYNKTFPKKPRLGCLVIQEGIPEIVTMKLDKHKRWVGF